MHIRCIIGERRSVHYTHVCVICNIHVHVYTLVYTLHLLVHTYIHVNCRISALTKIIFNGTLTSPPVLTRPGLS